MFNTSWTQITCIWCGYTIKLDETSSMHVWPPKHRLCCAASIEKWNTEQEEKTKSVLYRIWKMLTGK